MSKPVAILLLLLLLKAYAVSFKETRRAHKIRINTQSLATTESVAHYATTCAALVDKTLALDNPPQSFIDLEESPVATSMPPDLKNKIFFNEETEIQVFTYKILRAFIRRRQQELFGNNGPRSELSDYLAAALTFRRIVNMLSTAGGTDWDYSAARKLFESKSFPNAELLLTAPITPSFPLFFQLYAMHSEILLKTIEQLPSKRGNLLKKLLEMEAFGRDATDNVRYVLSSSLPSGMPLQAWYERHAIHNSLHRHSSDAPATLAEQVPPWNRSTSSVLEAAAIWSV